jgi:preprotein translocase subunit YajC
MRKITIVLALALSLLTSGLALAHEGHKHASHLMGTVTAITADRIEIRTKDGKAAKVPLTAATKYFKGTKQAAAADVKKGTRVILELGAKGAVEEVRLGAATKAKTSSTHAGHSGH